MFETRKPLRGRRQRWPRRTARPPAPSRSSPSSANHARMEGKFDIADSIQIECEVGGELSVGGKLVIGEKGVVSANIQTVDAIIMGQYEGNMVATGNVEIAETGRASGNIQTDSLVISKGASSTVTSRRERGAERRAPGGLARKRKRAGQQDLQR